MQPINYSLILNITTLLVCAVLACVFTQPLLVAIALVMQTHALERFQSAHQDDDEDEQPMGFTADVK
jgi:hypothetical protein